MAWTEEGELLAAPLMIPEWSGAGDVAGPKKDMFYRFASTDIDAVRACMCRLFRPHAIRPREQVHEPRLFELNEVALSSDLVLTKLRYNREVTIESPPLDEFFVIKFTLSGTCQTWQGGAFTNSRPGSLCVLNTTQPIRLDMDRAYSQMAVRISRAILEQSLADDLGHGLPYRLEFLTDAQPLEGPLASLARTVAMVWSDLAAGERSGYNLRAVQHNTQKTIAALLLSTFPHNFSTQLRRASGGPVPYFISRAERFIRDHAQSPIGLADIAQASAVSERTLQAGFRRFRSLSPTGYLKAVRLELARQALLASTRTRKTVTEIALECGFSHLSKFARAYKSCYGETPSETARRGLS